jgi:hypothetical protein
LLAIPPKAHNYQRCFDIFDRRLYGSHGMDGEWYVTSAIAQLAFADHLIGKLAGYEKLVTGRIKLDQHIKILVTPRKDISVGA